MNLSELAKQSHELAKDKGWWDNNSDVGVHLMNCVCELSEAMEEYRKGNELDEVYYLDDDPEKPEGFPIELADTFMRLADLCEKHNIDIERAIEIKLEYNKGRPYRHGDKLA